MKTGEIIEQLEELIKYCDRMSSGNDKWQKDIAAIEGAILFIAKHETIEDLRANGEWSDPEKEYACKLRHFASATADNGDWPCRGCKYKCEGGAYE